MKALGNCTEFHYSVLGYSNPQFNFLSFKSIPLFLIDNRPEQDGIETHDPIGIHPALHSSKHHKYYISNYLILAVPFYYVIYFKLKKMSQLYGMEFIIRFTYMIQNEKVLIILILRY